MCVCVRVEAMPLMILLTLCLPFCLFTHHLSHTNFTYLYTHMLAIRTTNDKTVNLSLSLFNLLLFCHTNTRTKETHTHTCLRLFGATPSLCHTEEAGVNYRVKRELKRWTAWRRRRNWTPFPHTYTHTYTVATSHTHSSHNNTPLFPN